MSLNEKAIKAYGNLKKSKNYQDFLNNMQDLFDVDKNPYMVDLLEKIPNDPNYNKNIYSIPFNTQEMEGISTECLLFKAKQMVDSLNMPDPANEDDLVKKTTLPGCLVQIKEEFDRRFANHNKEFPSNGELFNEYRALEIGQSIVSEISKLSEELYEDVKKDVEISDTQEMFEQDKTLYKASQVKLRYELDTFEETEPDKVYNIGTGATVFKNEEGVFLQESEDTLTISKKEIREHIDLYTGENNKFDKLIEGIDAKLDSQISDNLVELNEVVSDGSARRKKVESRYLEEEEALFKEYEKTEEEYFEISDKLKKEKAFNEFDEYNAFMSSIEEFAEVSEKGASEEYERKIKDDDVSLLFNSNDIKSYKTELDIVNAQIAELEKSVKENSVEKKEADKTYEMAKNISESNLHIDALLDEKDEQIAKNLAELSKVLPQRNELTSIWHIDSELFATPKLKELRQDAIDKFNECNSDFVVFDSALRKQPMFGKLKYDEVFDSVVAIKEAVKNIQSNPANKDNVYLQSLDLCVKNQELNDLTKTYDNKDKFGLYDRFLVIDKKVDALSKTLDSLSNDTVYSENAKDNEKEKRNITSNLKEVQKAIEKYKKTLGDIAKNAEKIPEKREEYYKSINAIYEQIDLDIKEKDRQRKDIEEFIKRDGEDKLKNQRQSGVSKDDLDKFKHEAFGAKIDVENDQHDLNYLKSYKNALEKCIEWNTVKSKMKKLDLREKQNELFLELEKRDEKGREILSRKEEALRKFDENQSKIVTDLKANHKALIEGINETKKNILEAKNDVRNIERAMNNTKSLADSVVAGKKSVNNALERKMLSMQANHNANLAKASENEDALFLQIKTSRKKYGWSSGVFRNLKNEIDNYQKLKREAANGNVTSEEYTQRTAALCTAIDEYIEKRNTPKSTKEGRLRLDYVFALKNLIEKNKKDILSYENQVRELHGKKPEIAIEPKTKVEYDLLAKKETETHKFFDKGNPEELAEKAAASEKAPSGISAEQKQNFAQEDKYLDEAEKEAAKEEGKELFEKAKKDADFARKKFMGALENEQGPIVINEEAPKETLAQKFDKFLHPGKYIPYEQKLEYQPEDNKPACEEFHRMMQNVPSNYGFEEFNSTRGFFKRYSLDKFKRENMAQKIFCEQNHIQDPMVSPEDAKKIAEFDLKVLTLMKKDNIKYDFGYKKYAREALLEKKEPVTEEEYYKEKFNITGDYNTAMEGVKRQFRADIAEQKYGLIDPRKTIKNYGETFLVSEYSKAEALKKIKEAKEVEDNRGKIVKEIEDYDKKLKKIDPAYGFKDYIKTKKDTLLTREQHIENNKITGKLMFMADHNLKKPGDDFKGTPEQKQAALEKFNKAMEKYTPDYGYDKALEEAINDEKQKYIAEGRGIEKYIEKHEDFIDPRIKYDFEIRNDMILAQQFKPEIVKDIEPEIINMSQLDENDLPEDYEANALKAVNFALNFGKENDEEPEFNPLSNLNTMEINASEIYKDYPDDLVPKIREYDRIMANIPNDYGYNAFEREVDKRGSISLEQYKAQGLGKTFFAQTHQLVDPRIDKKLAKEIKEFDEATAHIKPENPNYEEFKKTNSGITEKQYLNHLRTIALDKYCIKTGLVNPREGIENYGRMVLKKDEYKYTPIIDDTARLAENEKIVNECKDFLQELSKVDPTFGWKPYKKGETDIEEYVTKKEYALSNASRFAYVTDNKNVVDPFAKYSSIIEKDSELRAELKKYTTEFVKNEKAFREDYASRLTDDNDPYKAKRDIERAKTKALYDEDKKNIDALTKEVDKQIYSYYSTGYMNKLLNTEKEMRERFHHYDFTVDKKKEKFDNLIDSYKNSNDEEHKARRAYFIQCKRYCDKLTVEDISKERKVLNDIMERSEAPMFWQQKLELSEDEKIFWSMRNERVTELEAIRDKAKSKEQKRKELDKKLKDPEYVKQLKERVNKQKNPEVKKADLQKGGI